MDTTRGVTRVLAIPKGAEQDASGKRLMDDWLLCTCGTAEDGTSYYVTADHLHASEYGDLHSDASVGPQEMAQMAQRLGLGTAWRKEPGDATPLDLSMVLHMGCDHESATWLVDRAKPVKECAEAMCAEINRQAREAGWL